jgi:hypothetical protein
MSLSKSKNKSKETTTERVDPTVMNLMMGNAQRAQAIADKPHTPYSGPRAAGFSATQDAARAMTMRAVGAPRSVWGRPAPTPAADVRPETAPDYAALVNDNPDVLANYQKYGGGQSVEAFGKWFDDTHGHEDGHDLPMRVKPKGAYSMKDIISGAPQDGPAGETDFTFGPAAGDAELDQAGGWLQEVGGRHPLQVDGGATTGTSYKAARGSTRGYEAGAAGASLARSQGYDAAQAQAYDAESYDAESHDARATDARAAHMDRRRVRDLRAAKLPDVNIREYMNPFEDEVVGRTLQDQDRQRQVALNEARTDLGGSWGGSRQGVYEAELARAALDRSARTAAEMRMAGYDRATALATGDIDRDFAAQQAMMGVDADFVRGNAAFEQEVGIGNANRRTEVDVGNAARRTEVGVGNAARRTQISDSNAGRRTEVSKHNSVETNTARRFGADAYNRAELNNSGLMTEVNVRNTEAGERARMFGAEAHNREDAAYAARETDARRFGADTRFQAGQGDAERRLRAAMTNQSAGLQANEQRMGAARAMADLGGLRRSFALGNAQAVAGIGAEEQAQQQRILDLLYGDHVEAQNWDLRGPERDQLDPGLRADPEDDDVDGDVDRVQGGGEGELRQGRLEHWRD